jgi:phospholipid/cholesterol/gamma-HCH transport system ATP-binding protein
LTTTSPDTETSAVVTFENVRIGFDEEDVLRGVSFEVRPRETLVLLGETGTGKTLTLKLAAGLLRPTQGEIEVLGQDVSSMGERELLPYRRQLGFVFQEGALFDSMSVAENVAYQLREDRTSEEEIERRVREVLRFVELEQTVDMLPSELSGGMRRRVSIARALAARPPVMLYDSPTAGLDPVTAQTIITLILRSRDVFGVTAMLATQRVQDGFALANFRFDAESKRVVRLAKRESAVPTGAESSEPVTRFVVYREGRVYFEGKPEEMAESKDAYLQRFLAGI